MGSGGGLVGSREDHERVLVPGSGKWAKAKANPAAGDLALELWSINNSGMGWGSDAEIEKSVY